MPVINMLALSDEGSGCEETDGGWSTSTDLILNHAGIVNLGCQQPHIKVFIENAIEIMLQYIVLRDAYPNLTRKSGFMKQALRQAAGRENQELRDRIKNDKGYTSKVAHVVSHVMLLDLCLQSSLALNMSHPTPRQREEECNMAHAHVLRD
jgi:hypothetical protein